LSLIGVAFVVTGCVIDDDGQNPFGDGVGTYDTYATSEGDGDGDPGNTDDPSGDGDGDSTGDGDADPTTGDGDADPTTGDGDGDPPGCDGESPYMGGWDIGCCQDQVVGGGWQPGAGVGATIPDWTFTDQHGDAVRIYDFCHDAIYFEYVALW
jgi:hypothetical protein